MLDVLMSYWPVILTVASVMMGTAAGVHATMTKQDVRSAIGWVGMIMLSPLAGSLIYLVAGINRMRRVVLSNRRRAGLAHGGKFGQRPLIDAAKVASLFGEQFRGLKILGDNITGLPLTTGNGIEILRSGDETYARMCEAIDAATHSVYMESYIFDHDQIGLRIAERLIAAAKRGVDVRVIVDAVGARYTIPSIVGFLRAGGVPVESFNGSIITGLRLPFANMRTHRKILIVDRHIAFTGGMNISKAFTAEFADADMLRDTHFRVTGAVVADLLSVWADDWRFVSGEELPVAANPKATSAYHSDPISVPVLMRVIPSGPDSSMETNQKLLLGACSVARRTIHIMSPYFLPDRELTSALVTAARRGVQIDIVVPLNNDSRLVNLAMTGQFDQVLFPNVRIWRKTGSFDHSKLMSIDQGWAFVGSSNLDPRSLRLNFEVDLEVFDADFAKAVENRIRDATADAVPVTLASLKDRPFVLRLVERIIWLASPYL